MIYDVTGKLIIDHKCREYCTLPYPGHKKGCPNFNVHDECPPKVKKVECVFDFSKKMYFVVEEFDIKSHAETMKVKHPHWTERQCRNLLYWQGGVRKRLKEKTLKHIKQVDSNMIYTLLPEAMGIMVINTAQLLKIPIEKNPVNIIFKISLVGYSNKIIANTPTLDMFVTTNEGLLGD